MKKIIIVVADGRVESVFADEQVEVEVIDFDGASEDEQAELADYVDELRETKKEIISLKKENRVEILKR